MGVGLNVQCNNCCLLICVVLLVAAGVAYRCFSLITYELSAMPCRNHTVDCHYPEYGEITMGNRTTMVTAVKSKHAWPNYTWTKLHLIALSVCLFLSCTILPQLCFQKMFEVVRVKHLTVEKECGCTLVYLASEEL